MRWPKCLQMPTVLLKTKKALEGAGALSWGLLILLSLIWGSSFILIKKSLLAFSAGEVGALRIATAALFLIPIAIRNFGRVGKKDRWFLLMVGFVGSFLPAFLFAKAQTQLASGVTGVLNALTPLFVVMIGALFFGQKFTRRNTVGLIISLVGTVVLIMATSRGNLGDINFYAFYVVLATLCYGLNLNIIKYRLSNLKPVAITAISLVFVVPIAIVFLFGFTDFTTKIVEVEGAWLSLMYVSILGVIGTAAALIIFNRLVQLTTPMFASFVTYLIPIIAVIWGVIDGEPLFMGHYLGMVGIIIGVFIANHRKKTAPTAPQKN